jgi:hypothetical protein
VGEEGEWAYHIRWMYASSSYLCSGYRAPDFERSIWSDMIVCCMPPGVLSGAGFDVVIVATSSHPTDISEGRYSGTYQLKRGELLFHHLLLFLLNPLDYRQPQCQDHHRDRDHAHAQLPLRNVVDPLLRIPK